MEQPDVSRRIAELESLYELACDLLRLEDHDEMLDAVVERSLQALRAERGFLVLAHGDDLDFKVVRNWVREELEGDGEQVSRSILRAVMESPGPLLVPDASVDARFSQMASVRRLAVRSVLAAPLFLDGRRVGALYLESRSLERVFDETDLALFQRVLVLSSRALAASTHRMVLQERSRALERGLSERYRFEGFVTQDAGMIRTLETVGQMAASELPVLVQGPSGSGKELIARAIYVNSRRSRRPFLTVNCAAISPGLLESELFGHVRGAFTGAHDSKMGVIRTADGGTVFLDEVGELPKELQAKLLRTIQFGEVQPVGAVSPQKVDVRFVAATNRDLAAEVREGRFREDLLYRLNALTIDLPPLSARSGDVQLLFRHFLADACAKEGRPVPDVTPALERALSAHAWPGNVRDLENEVRRLVALTPPGEALTVERLSPRILADAGRGPELPMAARLRDQERELIELHLRQANGNRSQAARSLGISREGLRLKMKRHGL